MSKIIIFILTLCCSFVAHTQTLRSDDFEKLVLEKDSLKRFVIKPLNDSIVRLNSTYNKEVLELKAQLKSLEIEKNDLIKKNENLSSINAGLNSAKPKVERDNLLKNVDSLNANIIELKKNVSQKDDEISNIKLLGLDKEKQEKEAGKQEVLSRIVQTYNKPFDDLVKSLTINVVNRDSSVIGSNTEAQPTLLSLQKYYIAEQTLNEKYDEQKVKLALAQLSSIEQTNSVKNLTDKIDTYKLRNDGLKATIDKILKIDLVTHDEFDDKSQKEKLNDILSELAWYFRNYGFNFTDYPYLSGIVLEIINQKQKNASKDISGLKQKL